jgi:putative lipoic acid-binding regulatory protein
VVQDPDNLLEFPCDFPIKVIGKAGCDIDAVVFSLVRVHAPDLGEGAIRGRTSRKGNYHSVTVTIRASSRAQLDAIYRSLSAHEDILMVL